MLRSVNDVTSYNIAATDGELGSVHDVDFDDETWVVRDVVVDTGKWLRGRVDEVLGDDETRLRSCRDVTGYALQATDGELGHVEDVLFDDLDWAVRYIVVDPRNWSVGKNVVIPPEWVDSIDWSERTLRVDVSRDAVKRAPAYAATEHVNRQWEADYYAHHQRSPYWTSPQQARKIKARHFRPPIITT